MGAERRGERPFSSQGLPVERALRKKPPDRQVKKRQAEKRAIGEVAVRRAATFVALFAATPEATVFWIAIVRAPRRGGVK
jgi:hypothetical protein